MLRVGLALEAFALLLTLIVIGIGSEPEPLATVENLGTVIARLHWDAIWIPAAQSSVACGRGYTTLSGQAANPEHGMLCERYLYFSTLAGSFGVSTACLSFVGMALIFCIVVPKSSRSVDMALFIFLVSLCVPVVAVVTVALATAGAIPNAERFIASYFGFTSQSVKVARNRTTNLAIAAVFFYLLSFVIIMLRVIMIACTNKAQKEESFKSRNIEGVVQNRLVNDDAARQEAMIEKHKEEVRSHLSSNEPI